MNKPIQFITIDSAGRCLLTKEAEAIIKNIDTNVAVVCIAGIYRSGKSYLLNRLLGRQDGFEIGPTIASCTKGLWIWGEPVKLKNKSLEVLIIDTEGLASAFEDRNETIDMIIFCLGLLLSSLFIYNSMKNIDESAIENLALVLNFAKKIQGKYNEINDYANNFPSFLWVLRDFALELMDNQGNSISTRQYLENALKEENINMVSQSSYNQGILEEIQKKNDIRRTLKLFFKERDCYTLVRPVNDEKKLKLIDQLPTEELRPEFLSQMNKLVKLIFDNIRPKQIQGGYMNGPMYLNLIKMYLNSLNSDNIPDVKTSWKIVVDSQIDAAYKRAVDYYMSEMQNLDLKSVLTLEELMAKNDQIKENAKEYLTEFATLNIPINVCLDVIRKLDKKMTEEFSKNYTLRWKEVSAQQCEDLAQKLIDEYQRNPELNEVFTCLDTIDDVLKFVDDSETNEKKYEIMYPKIINYFVSFLKKNVKDAKTKQEEQLVTLIHEKEVLQGVADKQKKLLESTREAYEKQIKELKDEHFESRIDLEAKVDEKNKLMQNLKLQNENTIEEMRNKIDELNSAVIKYQKLEAEGVLEKKKRKKDKGLEIDDTIFTYKLDAIANRIDSMQNIFFKTEVEKVKNQMLTEMDSRYEQLQDEFKGKLKTAKKNCEKALIKIKESKDAEIEKLKSIIKDLNDEIQDYKSQVDSQEYKISLYKEKIINYEKEKKAQTDHAELLRVLAVKLNGYVDMLAKKKN